MALKKLSNAVEKKEESKSKMRVVACTDAMISIRIDEMHELKTKISELEKQVKTYKGEFEARRETVESAAIDEMVEHGNFDSIEFSSAKSALGFVVQDKYTTIKCDPDQVVKDVANVVGEKDAEQFLSYKSVVRPEALEDPKIWTLFDKFSSEIKAKFNVDLIEQKLEVKKGAVDAMLKLTKAKMKKLFIILKPQVNITLK